ncbi:MAG: hypothetical protein ACI89J_001548 [Hyphomicrobiaceae bacterium]|jgi:hypothetical protein
MNNEQSQSFSGCPDEVRILGDKVAGRCVAETDYFSQPAHPKNPI